MIRKVLVVGSNGYIGSTLIPELKKHGYYVIGTDYQGYKGLCDEFHSINFGLPKELQIYSINELKALQNKVDATVHLAGLVGYPACDKNPYLAKTLNEDLPKYINTDHPTVFISAADSIYGKQTESWVDEHCVPNPQSVYGKTKYEGEKAAQQGGALILRFSSVYGVSPHMRWDTLIHDWIKILISTNKLEVYQPDSWRNFLSIEQAIETILWGIRHLDTEQGSLYNVTSFFRSKYDLAITLNDFFPGSSIIVNETDKDPEARDYRITSKLCEYDLVDAPMDRFKSLDYDMHKIVSVARRTLSINV